MEKDKGVFPADELNQNEADVLSMSALRKRTGFPAAACLCREKTGLSGSLEQMGPDAKSTTSLNAVSSLFLVFLTWTCTNNKQMSETFVG